MNEKVDVLDHGFVRLVDSMGGDLAISRAARTSYDAPPREEDSRLIGYLWKHKHTSPFEAVVMTFEVKAPIFVFRQWHRHRTWSYNELSARYKELPEEFYVPAADQIGVQSTDNKQMRVNQTRDDAEAIRDEIRATCKLMFVSYRRQLAAGVPRELARGVLSFNTYSHMFATVNLLNLFRFCKLRTHEHAQHEIRVYAYAMLDLVEAIAPAAVAAYRQYGMEPWAKAE
jgi:thymidylate synthase (FAD)